MVLSNVYNVQKLKEIINCSEKEIYDVSNNSLANVFFFFDM
jgi:hypothetical protein